MNDSDERTHAGSYSHVPGYAEIHFQQALDGDGWELDENPQTPDSLSAFARSVLGGCLFYRRGEEWATVPNVWYNQPAEWRIRALEFQAEQSDRSAERAEAESEAQPWRRHDAKRSREQAQRLRDEARRLVREGNGRTIKPA